MLRVEGVSGDEGRRGVWVKRDGRIRMPEALRTVETGIFYLSWLSGKGRGRGLKGYQEVFKGMVELEA